jgi:hypothetical protein
MTGMMPRSACDIVMYVGMENQLSWCKGQWDKYVNGITT